MASLFQHKTSPNVLACWRLNIGVREAEKSGLEEIGRFVEAIEEI
jgi:hypothetical protein